MPDHIRLQLEEMLSIPGLSREKAELNFPEVLAYIRNNVSLVDLMRSQGMKLRPLSAERPDILVSEGCPCCGGGPVYVEA